MPTQKVMGLVLLVVGIVLLILAYNASQSITEQSMETLTGRYTDTTTGYVIAGAAAAVAGLGLLVLGRRK